MHIHTDMVYMQTWFTCRHGLHADMVYMQTGGRPLRHHTNIRSSHTEAQLLLLGQDNGTARANWQPPCNLCVQAQACRGNLATVLCDVRSKAEHTARMRAVSSWS